MRKLGLLVLPVLVMFFPSAANAAWQDGTPWPGPGSAPAVYGDGASFDKFNTGLLFGVGSRWDIPSWSGGFRNSLDGGASWGSSSGFPIGAANVKLTRDGDGNRIWAYTLSNTIVVTRSSPTAGPGNATESNSINVDGVDELNIFAQPSGDVLVAWSSKNDDAGVFFWAAGAEKPVQRSKFYLGCDSTSAPTPILDPDRYALFIWTCQHDGITTTYQSHALHVQNEFPFSNPQELDTGSVVRGSQAADGRAILLTQGTEAIPENAYGETSTEVLRYASRRAGEVFEAPTTLVGDAERKFTNASDVLPVTADGRVIVGFATVTNMPNPYYSCDPADYQFSGAMATGMIDQATGDLTLAKSAPASPGTRWDFAPRVAAGSDGRLAVAYGYATGCWIDPVYDEHILLALDGEHFEDINSPYGGHNLGVFTFTARGQIFVTALNPSWPMYDFSNFYDTDLPLTPAPRPEPPAPPTPPTGSTGSTGSNDSSSDASGSTKALAVTASQKFFSVRLEKGGRLIVKLRANAAGTFALVVTSGSSTVGRTSGAATKRITKLEIKLSSDSLRKLRRSGRIRAQLTSTFTPASGAAPAPLTRSLIFHRR